MSFHTSEPDEEIVRLIEDYRMVCDQSIRCSRLERNQNIYHNLRRFWCHTSQFNLFWRIVDLCWQKETQEKLKLLRNHCQSFIVLNW